MLKFFKVGEILRSLEELITSDEVMLIWNFVKILGRMLLIAHWFACFYWLIAIYEYYSDGGPNPWPIKLDKNYFESVDLAE